MRYGYETTDGSTYALLKEFARENRNHATEGERCLWSCLRYDALGVRFRRQHPICGYIADFICLSHKLIIEVDGGYHSEPEQLILDAERTNILNKEGYTVIRFTNEEIIATPDNVIKTIKQNLKQ